MSLIGKKMTFPTTIRAGDYIQWRLPASEDVFGNAPSGITWTAVKQEMDNL